MTDNEKELMPLGRAEIQDLIDELYEYGVDVDEHGNPDILMKTVTELTRIRHIISRPQPSADVGEAFKALDWIERVCNPNYTHIAGKNLFEVKKEQIKTLRQTLSDAPTIDLVEASGKQKEMSLMSKDWTTTIKLYLMHSYLYYEKDVSIIADEDYDKICKDLLDNFDEASKYDADKVLEKEALSAGTGYHLTYSDVIVSAANTALMDYEDLNAFIKGE